MVVLFIDLVGLVWLDGLSDCHGYIYIDFSLMRLFLILLRRF